MLDVTGVWRRQRLLPSISHTEASEMSEPSHRQLVTSAGSLKDDVHASEARLSAAQLSMYVRQSAISSVAVGGAMVGVVVIGCFR